jgi:hypothetical protein
MVKISLHTNILPKEYLVFTPVLFASADKYVSHVSHVVIGKKLGLKRRGSVYRYLSSTYLLRFNNNDISYNYNYYDLHPLQAAVSLAAL